MFRRAFVHLTTSTAKTPKARKAVSVSSGMPYPRDLSTQLSALGFSSNVWLSEKQMKQINVTLKPEEKEKGFTMESEFGPCVVYNAAQTTDVAKVEALKGRLQQTFAISGDKINNRELSNTLCAYVQKYPTSSWISRREITGLGLALKPNAEGVNVTFQFDDGAEGPKEVKTEYFNVHELEDPTVVDKLQKIYPVSAATGKRYAKSTALTLLKESLAKNYTSPFWLSMQQMQYMGLTVDDTAAFVELSFRRDGKTTALYNASQTSNPAKVANAAYKAQFQPRSAMTGATYPDLMSSELLSASTKNKFQSIYWLTQKQATFLGVSIKEDQTPTEVMSGDGNVLRMFNADQTTDPQRVAAHSKA